MVNLILGLLFLGVGAFAFAFYSSGGMLTANNIAIAGFAALLGALNLLRFFRQRRKKHGAPEADGDKDGPPTE